MRQSRTFLQAFLHNRLGMVGLVGVLLVVIMGLFAPLIAAYLMATARRSCSPPQPAIGWAQMGWVWIFLLRSPGAPVRRFTSQQSL